MRISKKTVASIALVAAFSAGGTTSLYAQNAPGTGPNPFRDCGIGAALFPTVNWAAVSSNIIWDVGTTAVTSATASPQTCQGQPVAAAAFIFETFDSIAEQTAQGGGEHLVALMNILEIDTAERSQVLSSVRSEMSELVGNPQYVKLSQAEKAELYYLAFMNSVQS